MKKVSKKELIKAIPKDSEVMALLKYWQPVKVYYQSKKGKLLWEK